MGAIPLSSEREELVDKEVVLRFLLSAAFWLVFAPTIGVILSIKFNYFGFLGGVSWLTWGRLRPVHVMGVIFGAFTTAIFGLTYYMVPRLCGVRMYKENWSRAIFWLWNLGLTAGLISLALGQNLGIEAGEFPVWDDILIEIVFILITIQIIVTVVRRKEKKLYVTLWYLTAAFVWTVFNYAFGHFILPFSMPGVNNAAMHGLYIHYVVGLWITPAGLAVIYYFLPLSAQAPLYSHKLSLIGFWSLAFFYPFVGTHHYIYSPIPYWTQTIAIVASMMLIIPVWTVIQNFYGTFVGHWQRLQESYTAKFLIIGAFYYLIGCFQGSTEALRGSTDHHPFHRLRDRTLPPNRVRHIHSLGHRRHVLRNSPAVRARAVLEEPGPVALVAYRGRFLAHGQHARDAGTDAGNDARAGGRLRQLHGGHETVLVHTNHRRRHHGHRGGSRHVELPADRASRRAHRNACSGTALDLAA